MRTFKPASRLALNTPAIRFDYFELKEKSRIAFPGKFGLPMQFIPQIIQPSTRPDPSPPESDSLSSIPDDEKSEQRSNLMHNNGFRTRSFPPSIP